MRRAAWIGLGCVVAAAAVVLIVVGRAGMPDSAPDGSTPLTADAPSPATLVARDVARPRTPLGSQMGARPGRAGAPTDSPDPAVARQLSGTVVDEDGRPVSGAVVDVLIISGAAPAGVTDAQGRFRVETEGPPQGSVEIRVSARGYATTLARIESRDEEIRVQLKDRGATIFGVVLDPSGRPSGGVEVRTQSSLRGSRPFFRGAVPPEVGPLLERGRTVTDTSGAFALVDLPPGPHSICALSSNGFAPSLPAEVRAPHSGVELRLRRGLVVQGVVRDDRNETVAGAYVQVWPRKEGDWEHGADGQTDEVGRFRFGGLLAGVVRVDVSAEGFLDVSIPGVSVGVAPLAVSLVPVRRLRFRLVAEDGEVLTTDLWALVLDAIGGDVGPNQRHSDGVIDLGPVGAGPFRVVLWADGRQPVILDGVRGDDPERTVVLREGLSIEGEFEGAGLGSSVEVYAVPSGVQGIAPTTNPLLLWPHSRAKNSSRKLLLDGLAPGPHDLVALTCYVDTNFGSAVLGRVEAGARDVKFALSPGVSIRGEVRRSTGEPVPVTSVQAYDERGLCRSYVFQRMVGEAKFVLAGLPPGRFDVVAWVDGVAVRANDVAAPSADLVITVP